MELMQRRFFFEAELLRIRAELSKQERYVKASGAGMRTA